jgi:NAD(P)-dependent dehydrogenase (short-subunit alcohol dehydrogenase family)
MIDALLDRTVLLGYARTGLLARRHLPGWPADPPRLDGKTVVLTGATSGIGAAAATQLAGLGADLHLLGRDERRTAKAAADVGATPHVCDVSSLASLRAFLAGWDRPVDVLLNNAGSFLKERRLSPDGVELTFATNVLGPFVLVQGLAPLMPSGGRIITMSSGGMYGQALDGDHLQNDDYAPAKAYARTKRAEVVLTEMWADRLRAKGIVCHSLHPGWAATPGVTESLPTFNRLMRPLLRTAAEGADTMVWLASAPEPGESTGLFWHDRKPRPTHLLGLNKETTADRDALWQLCEELAAD